MISGAQIRAARALLGWSQEALAVAADVSALSVKRLETGAAAVSDDLRGKVVAALEVAGVEFIPENGGGAGVRLRRPAASPHSIAAKIEELEARADAIQPGNGPPSPAKAMKAMKRAVIKNEVGKLRGKFAKSRARRGE